MSTLLELRTMVRTDMDLLDEPAVSDAEINSKINEGIKVAAAKILGLYEDYFLKRGTPISLVAGQAEYNYPTDIFGNKLRALIYRNGSTINEIPRQGPQKLDSFLATERAEALGSWSSDNCSYRPLNTSFRISPVPTSNETDVLIPWYIRDAAKLTVDGDSCDIPEWENVVVTYAKWKIASNKPGLGDAQKLQTELEALMGIMEDSLSNRVPDQWDLVDKDTSLYQEHS